MQLQLKHFNMVFKVLKVVVCISLAYSQQQARVCAWGAARKGRRPTLFLLNLSVAAKAAAVKDNS